MKALTLTQPWATLVALEAKRVETRNWRTRYHGPLTIHAGRRFPREAIDLASQLRVEGMIPWPLPFGAVIATAELLDCVPVEKVKDRLSGFERRVGNYSEGRYAFILGMVHRVDPIPCRGALGMWTLPAAIADRIWFGAQ